ncbi:methionyl-tRNA formyltransferase [Roseburia sp. 1XD42-69]|uniref:methionyl-tRNA formyltransferase n=1 Tax=Roseburia sp. 1XD42-69 TaxID=2320088 RepID=UPI000EA28DCA|nr:methionyl-tRNA formyltransferase [Roseburia sp. 1XD42-69]RKJ63079.1 methionyl-tRNA formyltransferase [Roseburia sp. 1XD42-69]
MRVVFMGTPDFAAGILEAVVLAGHEVVLAVSQPDKPKGRGKALQFPPVKEYAISQGIEVYQPRKVREAECVEFIRERQPEIIVVAAFGQILPKELLDLPKYGCINVHASLLPKYRGAAPIQWAVINGDKVSGVTIMRMDVGLDTGDIIETAETEISPEETGGSLFDKLEKLGAKLLVETMEKIENGTARYTKQEESQASHVGMIDKSMGDIDWKKSAVEIENLIRGLNPWPSAYTRLNGKTLKIWKALPEPGGEPQKAGCVYLVNKKELKIHTGDGVLSLLEVQLEGKKRMDIPSFLRGYEVLSNAKLG